MKKAGRILLVIACIVGIAASGVRLTMDKQVGKMAAQLDALPSLRWSAWRKLRWPREPRIEQLQCSAKKG